MNIKMPVSSYNFKLAFIIFVELLKLLHDMYRLRAVIKAIIWFANINIISISINNYTC